MPVLGKKIKMKVEFIAFKLNVGRYIKNFAEGFFLFPLSIDQARFETISCSSVINLKWALQVDNTALM